MSVASKTKKTLLITVGVIILLVIAFYAFVNYWANSRLPEILGDKVQSKNIDVNIIGNQARFEDPSVLIDSSGVDGFKLDLQANYILIDGFSLWDLLFSNKIKVSDFIIDSLLVRMVMPEKNPSENQNESVSLFVQDVFSQIQVKHFEVRESDFIFREKENMDTLYSVGGFNLTAEGIIVDTASIEDPFPLHFDSSAVRIKRIFAKVGEIYILTAEDLYKAGSRLSLGDFRVVSTLSRDEFVSSNEYEKARLDISLDSLGLIMKSWNLKGNSFEVDASKLELHRVVVDVYKDKNPPMEPPKTIPLLTTQIKKLPFSITIDTVLVKDSYVEYEQKSANVDSAGVVRFERLYMTAINFTNDTSRIEKHPVTTFDIMTQFMGAGELNAKIQLLMNTTDGGFEASGTLGPMNLRQVNPASVPIAGAKLEGQLNELTFDFKGDNHNSEGTLDFYYEGLDVDILKGPDNDAWLKSMLGDVVLRDKNTPEDSEEGEIYFVRYQNKGLFNYLWHSIRVGLVDVVVPVYDPGDKERWLSDQPKYKEDD